MGKPSPLRRRLRAAKYAVLGAVGIPVLWVLVRLYALTLRLRWENPEVWPVLRQRPVVLCFWHGDMVCIALGACRSVRDLICRTTMMTSPSRDGQLNGRFLRLLGCRTITGSSAKRGAQALLGLRHEIKHGQHVGIAVDGPRGPRGVAKPGAALLAKHAAAPMAAIRVTPSRAWHLKDWARTTIPKPFSTLVVRGQLLDAVDEIESGRRAMESALGGDQSG